MKENMHSDDIDLQSQQIMLTFYRYAMKYSSLQELNAQVAQIKRSLSNTDKKLCAKLLDNACFGFTPNKDIACQEECERGFIYYFRRHSNCPQAMEAFISSFGSMMSQSGLQKLGDVTLSSLHFGVKTDENTQESYLNSIKMLFELGYRPQDDTILHRAHRRKESQAEKQNAERASYASILPHMSREAVCYVEDIQLTQELRDTIEFLAKQPGCPKLDSITTPRDDGIFSTAFNSPLDDPIVQNVLPFIDLMNKLGNLFDNYDTERTRVSMSIQKLLLFRPHICPEEKKTLKKALKLLTPRPLCISKKHARKIDTQRQNDD